MGVADYIKCYIDYTDFHGGKHINTPVRDKNSPERTVEYRQVVKR